MANHCSEKGFSLIELLIVVVIALVIAGFAIPSFMQTMRNFRIAGDARSINSEILLAKMRAAARFTQTRVQFSRPLRQYRIQWWDRTLNGGAGGWANETIGSPQRLASGVMFGSGPVTLDPAGDPIGFSTQCLQDDRITPIPGTACVVFNSRGFPIDNAGTPTAGNQIWVNNGVRVLGVTVSITGLTRVWHTDTVDTSGAYWQHN